MASLALERAPGAPLPLRYLVMVPVWGVVAAGLILLQGANLFASRWAPGTIALVHVFTLGVLGNAVLGSLLQFLPVVVDARPWTSRRLGALLPTLFNAGLAGMVCGLVHWPAAVPWAATLLSLSLALFAGSALAGLRFDRRQAVLRAGLGLVLAALLLTAALGALLAWGWSGALALPMQALADSHAAIAVFGGVLLLLGTVGSVVLPMFQGTSAVPRRWLGAWIASLLVALLLAVLARLFGRLDGAAIGWLLAAPAAAFALAVLVLQWRAPHRRNATLAAFWRWGSLVLLVAAIFAALFAGSADPRFPVLLGVLGLAVALPALMLGMWLEIVGFLAWIELQRHRPLGVRVPSVDALIPEANKARLFVLHVVAGLALLVAASWPNAATTALAALALALAYGISGLELWALRRRYRSAMPGAREPGLQQSAAIVAGSPDAH